jgi:predicted metal-dependent hydrolase
VLTGDRSALSQGVSLFNEHRFWHAHEAWEQLWLPATGEEKQFLQGLIQLAAAYHHVQRGTYRGGVRLFDSALRRLAPFPPGHDGIDRVEAVAAGERHRERIARGESVDPAEYPQLRITID